MSPYPMAVTELVAGKYRLESVIGEGGMGVVYAATHIDLHCMVALKVIRPEFREQPELVTRLMLEARAAAQIRSEHVCRVLDVARLESGVPYVVMEYLEGKNLSLVLQTRGRLGERQAIDYILQACEAIAEAHRIGIIHRDLKPENLFLAEFPDGRRAIKVLDFRISKLTGTLLPGSSKGLTNPSSAMGSPHYMAPEQMAAARDVDARADIWALGAILHQLLTGAIAFDGSSLPAVCAAVLQSNPSPVRELCVELSPSVEKVILDCLVKDRELRIASVAELANRLSPYGSASSVQSATRISRLMRLVGANDNETESIASTPMLPDRSASQPPHEQGASPTAQPVSTSHTKIDTQRNATRPSLTRRVVGLGTGAALLVVGWMLYFRPGSPPSVPATSAVTRLELTSGQSAPSATVRAATKPEVSAIPPAVVLVAQKVDVQTVPAATQQAAPALTPTSTASPFRSRSKGAPLSHKSPATYNPYDSENFGGRR